MKRDTLKTIVGLVIIGLIVVVTFLYGNAQRQAQLRHDQDVKRQQQQSEAKTTAQPSVSTAQPKTAAPATNPAKPPTAAATPPSATATTPTTGATNSTKIPDTGASENALIPLTLLGLAIYGLRRSRRSLALAVRSR